MKPCFRTIASRQRLSDHSSLKHIPYKNIWRRFDAIPSRRSRPKTALRYVRAQQWHILAEMFHATIELLKKRTLFFERQDRGDVKTKQKTLGKNVILSIRTEKSQRSDLWLFFAFLGVWLHSLFVYVLPWKTICVFSHFFFATPKARRC